MQTQNQTTNEMERKKIKIEKNYSIFLREFLICIGIIVWIIWCYRVIQNLDIQVLSVYSNLFLSIVLLIAKLLC